LEKLKAKNQNTSQCVEAKRAIALFFQMCRNQESRSDEPLSRNEVVKPHVAPAVRGAEAKVCLPEIQEENRQNAMVVVAREVTAPTITPITADKTSSPVNVIVKTMEPTQERVTGKVSGASWVREFSCMGDEIALRHYSPKTHRSYSGWVRKLQTFTKSKSPELLTTEDVKAFLTSLAVQHSVAASTQNQAFNALLFFFRHVLNKEFGQLDGVVRAKLNKYIPVVLSRRPHLSSFCQPLIAKQLRYQDDSGTARP
jgi:hypothetical protein